MPAPIPALGDVKKDFICVSCWTSFQVDASTLAHSTMVACPSCGAQQPAGTASPGPAGPGADAEEVDEGGATLEMKLPPSLLAEIGSGQFGDTGGLVLPEPSGRAAPSARGGWGPPAAGAAPAASSGWAIPGAQQPSAPAPAASSGWAIPGAEQPSAPASPPPAAPAPPPAAPAPAPPPPEEPPAEKEAAPPKGDTVWRMKLPSGLVLTFPSIDMVRAWAAEKPADRMQIAYGDSEFQPFQDYLEVSREIEDPIEALRAVGKPRPKTNPGSAIPAFAPSSSARPEPPAPDDAAAAAAVERSQGARPKPMNTQFKFRTEEPSSPWPKRIALITLTVLLLGGGVVGVLLWQGIIG